MVEYQEIIIKWSERIQINHANDLGGFEAEGKDVLYQIYGDHHIYGRNILLYIGISRNAHNRFKAHLKGVFGYVNNLSVSIGEIENYNARLEIIESILISNHKPSYNKEFIHDLDPEAKKHKIILINNGNNEMLKTCCTNFWWVDEKTGNSE